MDPAREPRDPVPEGQPGAARCRTDATREPAREPRPSTPPGQPGAAGDRTDATRAPPQHRVVFEVLAEPPPKPMKRIEFAIDGRAAAEEEARRMSVRNDPSRSPWKATVSCMLVTRGRDSFSSGERRKLTDSSLRVPVASSSVTGAAMRSSALPKKEMDELSACSVTR